MSGELTRRTFLKGTVATAAALGLASPLLEGLAGDTPLMTTMPLYERTGSARFVRAVWVGTVSPYHLPERPTYWEGSHDGKTWGRLLKAPDTVFFSA